jgi:DNA polymerase elongation subunit (family B)
MDHGVFDDLSDDYEEVSMTLENGKWKVSSDDSAEVVDSLEEAIERFNELVKAKAKD